MPKPKILLLIFLSLLSFTWLFSSSVWKRNKTNLLGNPAKISALTDKETASLRLKAAAAKAFARDKGYNQQICFLVDMSLPSGENRFFVYHFAKDSVINAGVVTHGRCNENWLEGRKYGNTVGCGCTSLGKYKIGYSYTGHFGLAYKLYGLDKTNDKAFERFVVLHSHECVPESEVKDEICQSDGCPTVSPGFLQYIKPILNKAEKPVLLWIYEE